MIANKQDPNKKPQDRSQDPKKAPGQQEEKPEKDAQGRPITNPANKSGKSEDPTKKTPGQQQPETDA